MINVTTHPSESEYIRLGREFKVICQIYGLKEATITVRPHTVGEELTYQWLKAGESYGNTGITRVMEDRLTCSRKSTSTDTL